ncbi:putative GTPase activating protein [Trypanosoma theileri]|uniref:Putative GTPase activating protein n=1 Tax=Trypanosoma theileri TaxID=67003 RepID=A0A1X0NLM8_9TRYP|nr:putative GTPase activating protein [Trypanosoma theileri]ORC85567.1 putative GTPase activating protein [Trypanosoma theileri]
MNFVADQPRPLDDFIAITGLKKTYAKECFDRFGGYAPALASFAQSYASLPDEYFDEKEKTVKNADSINRELKLIYKRARNIKSHSGKGDKGVWGAYYNHQLTPEAGKEQKSSDAAGTKVETQSKIFGSAFGITNTNTNTNTNANTNTAAPASSAFNFGFGSAPPAASSSSPSTGFSTTSPFSFGGFGQAKKEEVIEKPKETHQEREVKYCEPSHFTGPFFEMPLFWKEEVEERCPLLNLNKGFLEANRDVLRKRLEPWLKKAEFFLQPVQYVEIDNDDEETVRVIIKDADRTFFHPDHRKKFVAFLNAMFHEFKAYGQAMSYLAGLCLLVLNEEETAAVLRYVSKTYIPGHWAAEAVGFASTAWVVEHFMKELFPDVAEHLKELKIWPDTYLQKILTGLCVHVLDFKELFNFLDLFMEGGMKFLIKFSLAVVEHFRSDLLKVQSMNDINEVYEIMRLDPKVADTSDIRDILKRAPLIDLGAEGDSIDIVRSRVYDAHVAPRLQRAPKTEAFEPCEVCNKRKPKWWNDDLGAVCNECKEGAPELTYSVY